MNQMAQPAGPRNGKGKSGGNSPFTFINEITTVVSQLTLSVNELVKSNKCTTRQISRLKTITDYNSDNSTLFSGEEDDGEEEETRGNSNHCQVSALRKNHIVAQKHGSHDSGKTSNKKRKGDKP